MFSTLALALKLKIYNSAILKLFLKIYKYVVHFVFGTTELYRICQNVVNFCQTLESHEFYTNLLENPRECCLVQQHGRSLEANEFSNSSTWSQESVYSDSAELSDESPSFPYADKWASHWVGRWFSGTSACRETADPSGSMSNSAYFAVYLPWMHLLYSQDLLVGLSTGKVRQIQKKPEALMSPLGGSSAAMAKESSVSGTLPQLPAIKVKPPMDDALSNAVQLHRSPTPESTNETQPLLEERGFHQRSVTDVLSVNSSKLRQSFSDVDSYKTLDNSASVTRTRGGGSARGSDGDLTVERGPLLNTTLLLEMVNTTANIVSLVDLSIFYSKKLTVERRMLETKEGNISSLSVVVPHVLEQKGFLKNSGGSNREPESVVLESCLRTIATTHRLVHLLNDRAATAFDTTSKQHEKKLIELWNNLKPGQEYPGLVSSKWSSLGFQGMSPGTDFRGMGILGLEDLVYFSKNYPHIAGRLVAGTGCGKSKLADFSTVGGSIHRRRQRRSRRSSAANDKERSETPPLSSSFPTSANHDNRWGDLCFAITGINITQFTLFLARTRALQHFFYKNGPTKQSYHEFYCWVYASLIEQWYTQSRPLSIMDFGKFFKGFKEGITKRVTLNEACMIDERAYLERRQQQLLSLLFTTYQ